MDAALAAIAADRLWTVAVLDYELGYLFEPAAAPVDWAPDTGRPLGHFWRFQHCSRLISDEAEEWLDRQMVAAVEGGLAGVGGLAPEIDENWHARAVACVRHYIEAGDCYQVNLTFPLEFSWFGAPLALYARLRATQPVSFGGVIADSVGGIVSLSPELFVERRGDRLRARPMKGTAPRAGDPVALLTSPKDRAENVMIVDLLRNDFGRIARNGSVKVSGLFEIEAYPTLWQMVSEVTADVPGRCFGDILRALFPCGSITGAPKIRAMQIAAELEEGRRRGPYTGAMGWIAPDGDFRLNVAIRTLELLPGGRGNLGVGSGIVADSSPETEWQECLLKACFLREADPGLKLIETLRREDGNYPRLDLHLQRLAASADWLGFAFDGAGVRERLAAMPVAGIWRVRLTLDKRGMVETACAPLTEEASGRPLALLAEARVDSRRPLQRHKTTSRHLYDAALLALGPASPVFDVVFLNERGEVAEGARSNVFVERDGQLLTPPLASGALPGVLRAELLASGRAREAVLLPADLQQGFWLGNALRGLIAVRLESPAP